jgi:hypothetical protein
VTFVLIAAEDRTGGGLQQIIVKAVQARRAQDKKPLLRFPPKHASLNGNAQLLADCEKYPLRRRKPVPYDHVVYVMDARAAWDVVPGAVRPSQERLDEGLAKLERVVVRHMEARARGALDDATWDYLQPGFHAHLLLWERESLILPVLSHFGFGPDIPDVLHEQHATERVIERTRPSGYGYSKPDAGARFLNAIAGDAALRDKVVQSNTSLQRIIQTLVDL